MKQSSRGRWGIILASAFGVVCVLIISMVSYWQYVNSVPPITPHLPPMPEPNGYVQAERLVNQLYQIQRPRPPKTWPNGSPEQLQAQLASAIPVLDAVRATLRHDWRMPPILRMDQMERGASGQFQEFAQFFIAESLLAYQRGDFGTAMQRSLDVSELGTRMARGAGPWSSLGAECDQLWLQQVERIVPRIPGSAIPHALERLRRVRSERPSLPVLLDEERLGALAIFTTIFEWYEEEPLSDKIDILRSLSPRSDLMTWDMIRLAWTPRGKMLADLDSWYRQRIDESRKPFHQRVDVALPRGPLWQILGARRELAEEWQWERMSTELSLLEAALAVRGHYLEHGRYPQRLTDIGLKWLPGAPRDAWGQPVAYRLERDGRPLISSVGPDGVDDAGRPVNLSRISRTMRGDLVFGRQSRGAWPK